MDANLKVLYAAVEANYGVAETLTQAMLCRVTDFATRQGTLKEMNYVRAHYGAEKSLYMGTYSKINVEFELTPHATAGTLPLWHPLMRCCGRDMIASTLPDEVTSDLVSLGHESATIGFHMDGELHTMVGCKGRGGLSINSDDHLIWSGEIWGITVEPTTAALPSPDLSGFQEPLPITNGNCVFSLHGHAGVLNSLDLNDGYNLVHRNKPGMQAIVLDDRNPGGSIQLDLPPIGTKNYHAIIKNHDTGALTITLGSVSGNIVVVSCPKVQLINPTFPETDGVIQLAAGLKLLPNSDGGDDEWKITLK